ncbi:MAG: CapA family protein [Minisyncoccales bacterium]
MKKRFTLFLILFLSLFAFGKVFLDLKDFNSELEADLKNFNLKEKQNNVTLYLTGDIMLDRGVEYQIKKNKDWRWPFLKIKKDLEKADILFGNLESQISDKGHNVGSIYSFRADPKAIEALKYADFNILSLANNHSTDYTKKALEDSKERLENEGIKTIGAGLNEREAYSPKIIEEKGNKVAFLTYSNFGPEHIRAKKDSAGIAYINWNNLKRIEEDIKKAKEKSDIVIVSLHAGIEYEKEPSSFQKEFSKKAIESGADIIAGHHPHVIQKDKKYKEGWIFYSLGNFLFDQSFSKETSKAKIGKIKIANGKIVSVETETYFINDSFQLEPLVK